MCVGSKIKNYLDESGITQKYLSEKANIELPKLNLALNGKRKMTFEEYENICWALGVGVDRFLTPKKPKKRVRGGGVVMMDESLKEIQEITDEFSVLDNKQPESIQLIYLKEKFYPKIMETLMCWIMGKKKVRIILDCDPDRKKIKMQINLLDKNSPQKCELQEAEVENLV